MAIDVTLHFDDDEEKALLTNMVDIDKYWQNAKSVKLSRVMNRLVVLASDRNPDKIPIEQKKQIIRDNAFETAAERNARMVEQIGSK